MDNPNGDHAMTEILYTLALFNALAVTLLFAHNHSNRKAIMSTQDAVDAVVAQLRKARTEIENAKAELLSKIADLAIQLDDAKVADQVDVSELVAVAQALDDIVPDTEPEQPADEPAAEEAVEEPTEEPAEEEAQDAPPF